MILYFSGTGNSRYIANVLNNSLNQEIVDLNAKIKTNDYKDITLNNNDETLIFVTPTYAWNIPRIIKNFIYKVNFINAKYVYFIMTCGESNGNAIKQNIEISKDKNLMHKGTIKVVMPENYIALFNAPTKEKAKEIVETAIKEFNKVIPLIRENKDIEVDPKGITLKDKKLSLIVNKFFYRSIVNDKKFIVDNDKCIKCLKCINVCPLNNISLLDNKITYSHIKDRCTHCMACISYCPKEAINYGDATINKNRYTIEEVVGDK